MQRTLGAVIWDEASGMEVCEGWISDLPVVFAAVMKCLLAPAEVEDKQRDVNVTVWDKDLMVLGLLIDGRQRGHRLSSSTGTDRAARV